MLRVDRAAICLNAGQVVLGALARTAMKAIDEPFAQCAKVLRRVQIWGPPGGVGGGEIELRIFGYVGSRHNGVLKVIDSFFVLSVLKSLYTLSELVACLQAVTSSYRTKQQRQQAAVSPRNPCG